MRIEVVVAVWALGAGCRDRGRSLPIDERSALVSALRIDGCLGSPTVWDGYDALALAILRRAPSTSADELRAQLAVVPLPPSVASTWITVRGGRDAIAAAVGLQCDAFTEAGGRLTWFARDPTGWRRVAMLETATLARPEVLWMDPVAGRVLLSETASSTQDEISSIRALILRGGRFEDVAVATGLRAIVFEPTPRIDGVRFRHQTLLTAFSPSSDLRKQYEETWRFADTQPTMQRVPLTPWLDALDEQCAKRASAPGEAIGCGATLVSASQRQDGKVEVVLQDGRQAEELGCPSATARSISVTFVMEDRGGAWRVVERRVTDPRCARDAGT